MKRILSLDGGGVKGVFSLQVLAAIERLFREEHGRPDLVLADVYDLFAGTSTGAIIAACLAWGKPVSEIQELYLQCGQETFTKQPWYYRWKSKYQAEPLSELLRRNLAEIDGGDEPALLGSSRLRKYLLVVMRNASTGSPWPITNHPGALYNNRSLPDCNLNIPLWELIRGSTAAPVYFEPEAIEMGEQQFLFMDGAMTPFNNPTLIAVLMATLPQYGFAWPGGREQLHVVSIGTCSTKARLAHRPGEDVTMLDAIKYLAPALIGAVSVEQDLVCRVLGDCVYGAPIDSEVKALDAPTLFSASEQKFTYVRYDQALDAQTLEMEGRAEIDDLTLIPRLQKIGEDYAAAHVKREHLYPRGHR
ncbi:MAG TPA: patatin-like phospholipase family protein [Vicinamibacterales bacterium]|nr:patatin-like phospholipase family protein [Vicinamibacterales bacterium]